MSLGFIHTETRSLRRVALLSRILRVLAIICAAAFPAGPLCARAQQFPRWEFYGGVPYTRVDLGPEATIFQRTDKNHFGLEIRGSFNPRRYLRIILCDFSVQIGGTEITLPPEKADVRTSQVLFGPEFVRRSGKTAAFAHTLIGVTNARLVSTIGGVDITPDLVNHTSLAFGLGGGLDFQVRRMFAVRAIQLDYIPTRISGSWESHSRLSAGVVWTWGNRPSN